MAPWFFILPKNLTRIYKVPTDLTRNLFLPSPFEHTYNTNLNMNPFPCNWGEMWTNLQLQLNGEEQNNMLVEMNSNYNIHEVSDSACSHSLLGIWWFRRLSFIHLCTWRKGFRFVIYNFENWYFFDRKFFHYEQFVLKQYGYHLRQNIYEVISLEMFGYDFFFQKPIVFEIK